MRRHRVVKIHDYDMRWFVLRPERAEQEAAWKGGRLVVESERRIGHQRFAAIFPHRRVLRGQRAERLKLLRDRYELAIVGFERVVKRAGCAIKARDATFVARVGVDVVADSLGAVRQRGEDEVAQFVGVGNSHHLWRPSAGLHNIEKRHASFLRGAPDERKIQEILIVVATERKLVVVVADECGLHLLDEKAQVLLVGGDNVALVSKLLVAGVGRKEVDVGEVRRVALAQVGNEPP